eukprot:5427816-Amphidinium_carterae.1
MVLKSWSVTVSCVCPCVGACLVMINKDAINATKAATEEGIVPGGGTCLVLSAAEFDTCHLPHTAQITYCPGLAENAPQHETCTAPEGCLRGLFPTTVKHIRCDVSCTTLCCNAFQVHLSGAVLKWAKDELDKDEFRGASIVAEAMVHGCASMGRVNAAMLNTLCCTRLHPCARLQRMQAGMASLLSK